MKNKKKIAIAIAILAILIIGIGIFLAINKNNNVVSDSGTEAELPDSVYYVPEGSELTEDHLQEIIDYMNSYDEVLIKYYIFEDIYDEDELFVERNYLTEFASVVGVKDKTDETYNTHLFYDENGNFYETPELLEEARTPFKEAYGFDFKEYDSVYDLVCAVAKTLYADPDKFVGSKENGNLSEYIKENYGQSYYYYKNDNKDLIASIGDYDEIIKISSNSCMYDVQDGEFITYITTIVKYKRDNQIIEKTYSLAIQMYDSSIVYDDEE